MGRSVASLPFGLTALGLLMVACGSRTSATFEPAPTFEGAAGSEVGVAGSADDGVGGAGGSTMGVAGSAMGVAGSAAGGAGEPMMARDGGIDASRDPSLTFSPSEFGDRLAMWLDGSFGLVRTDDGIVSIWVDRTANGNDAYAPIPHRPRRQLILGSHSIAAVFFDGDQLMSIADSSTLRWGTDDYTIEVVASYVNRAGQSAAGRACLYEKTSPVGFFYGVSFTGNGVQNVVGLPVVSAISSWVETVADLGRARVTGSTTGVNDAAFHLFSVRRTAVHTLEVRLDGASDGINSNLESVDVSAVGQPVYIGGVPAPPLSGPIDALSGAIAEIIAIHGSITEDEQARLERYLMGKYRL